MKTEMKSRQAPYRSSIAGTLFIVFILFTACGTKQGAKDPQNFDELKDLVNSRDFAIEFQMAQPQGGGIIDLMSNPNHIRFKGDEVEIFLPYFGVRHMGGGYGSNSGGIKYDGEVLKLNIKENQAKNNIQLKFEGRQGSEMLIFNVTLYENGKAQARVSSSERNSITYQGGDVKSTTELDGN